MTYFNKNKELKRGYNAYIDESTNYMGTLMNVGLLVMEDGDTYTYESADREVAILLFEGKVTYEYAGKTVEADRQLLPSRSLLPAGSQGHQDHPDGSQPQRALHAGHPEREGL